jgi:hypothetical protein
VFGDDVEDVCCAFWVRYIRGEGLKVQLLSLAVPIIMNNDREIASSTRERWRKTTYREIRPNRTF